MKKIKIYAPVDGVVRKLSYGKDAIFSKKNIRRWMCDHTNRR